VNIERALRLADRLGGHLVQGHIDGTATLAARRQSPQETVLEFLASASGCPNLLDQMILKGSVAIDGVSLTLATVDPSAGLFAVALIPTTLALTTLDALKIGDAVNIETDMIGKWVRRYLVEIRATGGLPASVLVGDRSAPATQEGPSEAGITMDTLREAGFA
jgi:riboflavin synthase